MCNCNWRFNCTLTAVITAVIAGVVAAFLQILGIITLSTAFVVGALITGAAYLAIGVVAAANLRRSDTRSCCVCRRITENTARSPRKSIRSILITPTWSRARGLILPPTLNIRAPTMRAATRPTATAFAPT